MISDLVLYYYQLKKSIEKFKNFYYVFCKSGKMDIEKGISA